MRQLGEILLDEGLVNESQLLAALDQTASSGQSLGRILVEEGEGSPYANFIAVRAGDETNESLTALDELLRSEEVAQYIEENWSDGAVLPAF